MSDFVPDFTEFGPEGTVYENDGPTIVRLLNFKKDRRGYVSEPEYSRPRPKGTKLEIHAAHPDGLAGCSEDIIFKVEFVDDNGSVEGHEAGSEAQFHPRSQIRATQQRWERGAAAMRAIGLDPDTTIEGMARNVECKRMERESGGRPAQPVPYTNTALLPSRLSPAVSEEIAGRIMSAPSAFPPIALPVAEKRTILAQVWNFWKSKALWEKIVAGIIVAFVGVFIVAFLKHHVPYLR